MRHIKADIWNYNPNPVFDDTSLWVMFENGTGDRYYQVGWDDDPSTSYDYEQVFSEGWSNNGYFRYFYKSDGTWSQTPPGIQPPSSKTYKLYWIDGTPYDQIQVQYDNGTTQNLTVGWTPLQWDVLGEVHDYQDVAGTDRGDHSPGDTTNTIHVENVQVYGYDGHSYWEDPPSYTHKPDEANMGTSLTGVSGTGYRIWDKRCSD